MLSKLKALVNLYANSTFNLSEHQSTTRANSSALDANIGKDRRRKFVYFYAVVFISFLVGICLKLSSKSLLVVDCFSVTHPQFAATKISPNWRLPSQHISDRVGGNSFYRTGQRMVRLCIASVDPIKLSSQCVMCSRRGFPTNVLECTGMTKVNELVSSPLSVAQATCLIISCRREMPHINPEPYHSSAATSHMNAEQQYQQSYIRKPSFASSLSPYASPAMQLYQTPGLLPVSSYNYNSIIPNAVTLPTSSSSPLASLGSLPPFRYRQLQMPITMPIPYTIVPTSYMSSLLGKFAERNNLNNHLSLYPY